MKGEVPRMKLSNDTVVFNHAPLSLGKVKEIIGICLDAHGLTKERGKVETVIVGYIDRQGLPPTIGVTLVAQVGKETKDTWTQLEYYPGVVPGEDTIVVKDKSIVA
jgi:hypothetical protein